MKLKIRKQKLPLDFVLVGSALLIIAFPISSIVNNKHIINNEVLESKNIRRDSLVNPLASSATVTTTAVDWGKFNIDDKSFPVWSANVVVTEPVSNLAVMVIFDSTTTGLPNGGIGEPEPGQTAEQFWEDLYFYRFIDFPQSDSITLPADDGGWNSFSNPSTGEPNFDWDKENQNTELGFLTFDNEASSSPMSWYLSRLSESSHKSLIDFKLEGGEKSFIYNYIEPVIDNFRIFEIEKEKIILKYDIQINGGPSNVSITANGLEVYNKNIVNSGADKTFVLNNPEEGIEYTFEIFLNGAIKGTVSDFSLFDKAQVIGWTTYSKNNFTTDAGITENGLAGAQLTLLNPSNVEIKSVNFELKNIDETSIAIKAGTISASDINTYVVNFSENPLVGEEYLISYTIEFNEDESSGPHQLSLSDEMSVIISNEKISGPIINFNSIEVINHPDATDSWNNGNANANYSINNNPAKASIKTMTYKLYKENSTPQNDEIISSGDLVEGNNKNLSFIDLTSGNYYVEWEVKWKVLDPDGSEVGNEQTTNGKTAITSFIEKDQQTPTIGTVNLTSTDWLYETNNATVNGQIVLNNSSEVFGKKAKITAIKDSIEINSIESAIGANGVIEITDLKLDSEGDYTFKIEVLDHRINSSSPVNYEVGTTDVLTINKYQFLVPTIEANAVQIQNKLHITFHSLDGTQDKPWLDMDEVEIELKINYKDGTSQNVKDLIAVPEDWIDLFPQATFTYDLDKIENIESIDINGKFKNHFMDEFVEIKIHQNIHSKIPINLSADNSIILEPWMIAIIVLGSVFLLLIPLLMFSIWNQKNKKLGE
ncbi:MAG: hypothetical protein HRS50_02330 [Mycoplasmataceae bacterium]|nr:hypothetical protein [Mycoplasmataceae bacterium]